MTEAILVPINKDNISEYVNFENEYDNNLKEYQTRIHPNNHQDFHRLIAEKLLVWYYIEVDNKLIGSIWLEKALTETNSAVLGIFICDDTYRGLGIGEKSIKVIIAKCATAMNLKTIELNVRLGNSRAISCYNKCGFIEKEKIVKNGVKAIHMILLLYSTVQHHYDSLIDENNDPARDPKTLQEYMDKWDGQAFIDELQLSPDKTMLEIGVGTGRLALKVCGKCKHFVGIDISQKTINRAKENMQAFENITLICADFMDYQFDNKYDVIYSSLTFMHIKEKQTVINKVASLLTPNGRFVLSIDKNQSTVLDMGNRKINLFPATADEISKYITAAGLQTEKQFETEFATIFVAVKE